jgi:TolB-like protein/class 3 adenylate cyclase
MSETRKLAAILAADVVGYSRLMGEDEAGTAKIVRERREAATPIVRSFGGRLVKTMGDGVLLEFPSVVAAVECAIAIQKMMAERNATLPEAKHILYRVGVNLGDILIDGDDILGDGVNVAARLEGISEPGGVCLSSSAYEQVRGRVEADFFDLGEQTLKNIPRPVRAYTLTPAAIAAVTAATPASAVATDKATGVPARKARGWSSRWDALAAAVALALIAAGAYAWHSGFASRLLGASVEDKLANAPRLSIVVLPFENMSGDKEQDYFADGITDDLTTDLSHLPDSFVISRGTAFTYKGKPIEAKQIGRELGVRYLLEGSVRRAGDKVEVNAQLISTETGAHVWADRFEGERGKLGGLQVEVVSRLANSLGAELIKAESLRAMRERPNNPDAVDLAMQGWATYYKGWDAANVNEALDYFERALRLDPDLMRARVGLALMLVWRAHYFGGPEPTKDVARAESLAASVLAAEPNNAWAHYAKAELDFYGMQFDDTLSELKAVLENDRNLASAHAFSGAVMAFLGRAAETFPYEETALRLGPRDTNRHVWEDNACFAHALLAQWQKAVEWCQQSIATNPGLPLAYAKLAAANAWLGRDADAKAAVASLLKLNPGFTVQNYANFSWSDDPTFKREYSGIIEGLRKAGLPEGEKKTD